MNSLQEQLELLAKAFARTREIDADLTNRLKPLTRLEDYENSLAVVDKALSEGVAGGPALPEALAILAALTAGINFENERKLALLAALAL